MMKNKHQIAAEAAADIGVKAHKNVPTTNAYYPDKAKTVIEAAIEKATAELRERVLDCDALHEQGYERGYAAGWEACDNEAKMSAAHASEDKQFCPTCGQFDPNWKERAGDEYIQCPQCGWHPVRKAHDAPPSEGVELTCPHCHAKHTHYIDTDQYQRGYAAGWEACDNEAKMSAAHASESPESAYHRGYDAGWEAHKERKAHAQTKTP